MEVEQQVRKSKKGKIALISLVIFVIIIVIIGFFSNQQHKKAEKLAAEKRYVKMMNQFVSDGLDAGEKSEDMVSTYQDVWHDAIFEDHYTIDGKSYRSGDDFNDAMKAQYSSFQSNGDVTELEADQVGMEEDMKKLKNPPEKYKSMYKDIVDAYSSLDEFIQLADNPEGSLDSYTDKYNKLDGEVAKKLKAISVQLPNK